VLKVGFGVRWVGFVGGVLHCLSLLCLTGCLVLTHSFIGRMVVFDWIASSNTECASTVCWLTWRIVYYEII
jgi:hypothetical protein